MNQAFLESGMNPCHRQSKRTQSTSAPCEGLCRQDSLWLSDQSVVPRPRCHRSRDHCPRDDLDTLSGRSPLSRLEEFFAHHDTALLLGRLSRLQPLMRTP